VNDFPAWLKKCMTESGISLNDFIYAGRMNRNLTVFTITHQLFAANEKQAG
jgi:hypothetical protein